MWIVKIALNRPYTFIILALLILALSPVVILKTPTDIFPSINIPVVAVAWQYSGLDPEEIEGRLTTPYEKLVSTLVDNIEHTESTSYNGVSVVKIFLQPGASLDTANAQVTAASQTILRQLPPETLPPEIINFSAGSVPILQIGISGKGLDEQKLNDLSTNFVRPPLITVPARSSQRGQRTKRRRADRYGEDRQQGIRCPLECGATHDRRTQRSAHQVGERSDGLCPRCRDRRQRRCLSDQYRAPGRQTWRADQHY
jgi:hypothetical protein